MEEMAAEGESGAAWYLWIRRAGASGGISARPVFHGPGTGSIHLL